MIINFIFWIDKIKELLLERSRRGHSTNIHKVKAHCGIHGNEKADAAAGLAARNSGMPGILKEDSSNHHLHSLHWLTTTTPAGHTQLVNNLTTGVRDHIHDSTCTGLSNSTTYTNLWQNVQQHIHHATSHSMWSSCNFNQVRTSLKHRFGVLWNNTWAQRMGLTAHRSCPLCNKEDSGSHTLLECTHPTLKSMHIARHNLATVTAAKAIRRGKLGACYMIMDAGRLDNLPEGLDVATTRIPPWMLPQLPAADRQKLRPDILLVENLTPQDIEAGKHLDLATRHTRPIHIVEVGYCRDIAFADKLQQKLTQHAHLSPQAGWLDGGGRQRPTHNPGHGRLQLQRQHYITRILGHS